jgi:hypothetical protein
MTLFGQFLVKIFFGQKSMIPTLWIGLRIGLILSSFSNQEQRESKEICCLAGPPKIGLNFATKNDLKKRVQISIPGLT